MTYKSHNRSRRNRVGRVKKRLILLLIFIPLFLLAASFFVFAAAQDNKTEQDIMFWNNNRYDIIADYMDGRITSDVAGTIQFDEKRIIPIYSSVDRVEDGASIFGDTVPGQAGRTIILGHKEHGFVYLSKIEIGDKITVDSYEGTFVYTVNSVEIVVPSDIPFDDTEESVLTLVSQYPFRSVSLANRRYVVEAILD